MAFIKTLETAVKAKRKPFLNPIDPKKETEQNKTLRLACGRAMKMQVQRNKNLKYVAGMVETRKGMIIEEPNLANGADVNEFMDKMQKRLSICLSQVLGAVELDTNKHYFSMKTGNYCNHRLCNVCNALRSKLLRKRYYNFFTSDKVVLQLDEKYFHFFPNLDTPKHEFVNYTSSLERWNEIETPWVDDELGEILEDLGIDTNKDKWKGKAQKKKKATKVKQEVVLKMDLTGEDLLNNLDFMHLTLTFPHKNGMWNGKQYYGAEMKEAFNHMRKNKWWKNLVFGGEYCIETTKNNDGLHIHIHAMIMVKKCKQSRNKLHALILDCWNYQSIDYSLPDFDSEGKQIELSEERVIGIGKSMPSMSDEEKETFIKCLNYKGSTMIGLSTLFFQITETEYNIRKYGKFMQDGKFYARCNDKSSVITLTRGIMECLKYHFEPAAIEDDNGLVDIPLLAELLPNIFNQRLYGKFGCLYGIKTLNVQDENLEGAVIDEVDELKESAKEYMHHPYWGTPVDTKELVFVSVDLKHLLFNDNGRHSRINPNKINFAIDGEGGENTLKNAISKFCLITTHKKVLREFSTFYEFNK